MFPGVRAVNRVGQRRRGEKHRLGHRIARQDVGRFVQVGNNLAASDMAAGATIGSGRLRWDVAAAAMEPIALANGASTAPPASALKGVAPRVALRSPIALLSMPDEPKTPGLAKPQPARAIVPHNTTNGTSCRGRHQSLPALHLRHPA